MVGLMFSDGSEVRQDYVKAAKLFDIAARQGDDRAIGKYMDLFGDGHVAYRNGLLIATGR